MTITLKDFITIDEFTICHEEAMARKNEQVADIKSGDNRASYSFGSAGKLDTRSDEERYDHAMMGAMGELMVSKVAGCPWTREKGQYKGNKNPDLKVKLNGKTYKCESRATKQMDTIIYRQRDAYRPDDILIATTNLPRGPICKIGWAFFKDLGKLVAANPQWAGKHSGAPYYWVPFEHLSTDFSNFGD